MPCVPMESDIFQLSVMSSSCYLDSIATKTHKTQEESHTRDNSIYLKSDLWVCFWGFCF